MLEITIGREDTRAERTTLSDIVADRSWILQIIGNLIRVLIPLVILGLMAWILYKFYGGLMKIRDELRHINETLRERKPNL